MKVYLDRHLAKIRLQLPTKFWVIWIVRTFTWTQKFEIFGRRIKADHLVKFLCIRNAPVKMMKMENVQLEKSQNIFSIRCQMESYHFWARRVTTKVFTCARKKSERLPDGKTRVNMHRMLVLKRECLIFHSSLRVAHFPNWRRFNRSAFPQAVHREKMWIRYPLDTRSHFGIVLHFLLFSALFVSCWWCGRVSDRWAQIISALT